MKITKIRDKNGESVDTYTLERVCIELERRFDKAGFITGVEIRGSAIYCGMRMKSFTIDPKKRGHNADTSRYAQQTAKGYRRTTIPTWDERKEYNHIINDVLDKFKLKANAYNSVLYIRYYDSGRVNDWFHFQISNGERVYYEIHKEKDLLKESA